MTNKFKVTFSNGATEEMFHGAQTVAELANEMFGSTWEDAQAAGASIELIEEDLVDTTEQVPSLTTSEVAALTTSEVAALTTSEVAALTTSEVAALTTEQISAP